FSALRQQFPRIGDVQVLLKRGRYQNEMTQFRYDVILRLGARQTAAAIRPLDWQDEKFTLTALPQFLSEAQPEVLALTNVPNARVFSPLKALELLAATAQPETVGDLREVLTQMGSGNSVDPEDVAAFTNELPYAVSLGWNTTNSHGSFDIVCQRRAGDNH